jgi:OOP family OmpA-OmpF porin
MQNCFKPLNPPQATSLTLHASPQLARPGALWAAACVASALALAPKAHAQSALEGYYLGGSLGQAHYKDGSPLSTPLDDADTGFKLNGGYRFNRQFSLELGYADLGHFKSDGGGLKVHGLYLDAVATLPIAPQWSALGRLGVFNSHSRLDDLGTSTRDTRNTLKVGAGLQYDLTPQTALRGEWERYGAGAAGRTANTDLYSLGVQVKF